MHRRAGTSWVRGTFQEGPVNKVLHSTLIPSHCSGVGYNQYNHITRAKNVAANVLLVLYTAFYVCHCRPKLLHCLRMLSYGYFPKSVKNIIYKEFYNWRCKVLCFWNKNKSLLRLREEKKKLQVAIPEPRFLFQKSNKHLKSMPLLSSTTRTLNRVSVFRWKPWIKIFKTSGQLLLYFWEQSLSFTTRSNYTKSEGPKIRVLLEGR